MHLLSDREAPYTTHLVLSYSLLQVCIILYSSCLVLLLPTSLRHYFLFSSCLTLSNRSGTLYSISLSRLTLSNRSASFFTLLFLSCLTLSNKYASFLTLHFLSCLTLSNRSVSFFTLLIFFFLLDYFLRYVSFFILLFSNS